MKRRTRLLALVLTVCMAVSLLAMPAGAVTAGTATFSDVTDSSSVTAIETLRLMGVLDGYSNGTFRPNGTLTRAQFCKMAVYACNAASRLGNYRSTTIFPDVKPSHWASSYINLAAKGQKIIAGYADGYFHPNNAVTYAQAVTILMRVLGYTDEVIGSVWPDGYLAQAQTIGLSKGLNLSAQAKLTREHAATLFYNLLHCKTKDSKDYVSTIGTPVENAVLVSSDATAANGAAGCMQLASGSIYPMANKSSSGVLNGRKGTLVLDAAGNALTFVPDNTGSSVIVMVAETSATLLKDSNGRKYVMTSDIPVYNNGAQTNWGASYSWLGAGTTVTLYTSASGSVDYVIVGGGTAASKAVIIGANGSTVGLSALAGTSGYTIFKDGVAATAGDLRQNDVATYSSATNTIRVCDNKLSGIYENCSPSLNEPTSITVMGHPFTVLASAWDTLSKFKLGDQITLLLTEDNQVAGAVSGNTGNVLGIATSVTSSSATVELLCGITVKGTVAISENTASQLNGALVNVSSGKKDYLTLIRPTSKASGTLDVTAKKLGSTALRDNVIIYQRDNAGKLSMVNLSSLTNATIPASGIIYAGTDWAGRVSVVVLGDAYGGTYLFGLADYVASYTDSSGVFHPGTLKLTYGNGLVKTFETGYAIPDDTFVGLTFEGSSLTGYVSLAKISGISNNAWLGETAVTAGGVTYTVPSSVLCYNRANKSWLTLSEAHAFSTTCNLYVYGGAVRVVEVG